jgi:hypothetical protein
VADLATAAAANAAASAIAAIEVRHTTVRQQVEKHVIDRPVFRECRSGMDVVKLLNEGASNAVNNAAVHGQSLADKDRPGVP